MMLKLYYLKRSTAGFTLLEMLVTIVIVGILAVIVTPSWLAFMNQRRLNAAQEQALISMRDAQTKAKQQKTTWETCFYDNGTRVLASVHTVNLSDTKWDCTKGTNWKSLTGEDSKNITINSANSTLAQSPSSSSYYRVQFKYDGAVNGQMGRITFIARKGGNNPKRCVWVSTLLGALRTAEENRAGDEGCTK